MKGTTALRWIGAIAIAACVDSAISPRAMALDNASVAVLYFFAGNGTLDAVKAEDPTYHIDLGHNATKYGDKCTELLTTSLKQLGFQLFPMRPGADESAAEASAKAKGLRPVMIAIDIGGWPEPGTFRNAAHFAKYLVSPAYRKYQLRLAEVGFAAISYGYVRAALIATEKQPVVKPDDFNTSRTFRGLDGSAIWRSFVDDDNYPNAEVTDLLHQMKDLFNFDETNPAGSNERSQPPPKRQEPAPLSGDLVVGTSHDVLKPKYVSLTMANILAAQFSMRAYGTPIDPTLSASVQGVFDRVALECSKSNYGAELDEIKKLGSDGHVLVPVDLDAFQKRHREIRERRRDAFRYGHGAIVPNPERYKEYQGYVDQFDEIQAVK